MVINSDKKVSSAPDSLAILVSTDQHLDPVINLTTAAFAKGKSVNLLFTGKGVLLTIRPQFRKLVGKATVSICDVSFRANGLHGRENEVPGVTRQHFVTQAKNAQLMVNAKRHLVF